MFERILEVLGSDAPFTESHAEVFYSDIPPDTSIRCPFPDEEHDKLVSANSVDAATNRLNPSSLAASPSCRIANDSRESKPYTNRNLMTIRGKTEMYCVADPANCVNFVNSAVRISGWSILGEFELALVDFQRLDPGLEGG